MTVVKKKMAQWISLSYIFNAELPGRIQMNRKKNNPKWKYRNLMKNHVPDRIHTDQKRDPGHKGSLVRVSITK